MAAKIENWWQGSADANSPDFVLTWDADPPGGADPPDDIDITTECETAAALAAAIDAAFTAATADAWTVSVSATTGAYTIAATGGTFALTVNEPIKTFLGLDATYGAGQTSITGSSYPPSCFFPVAPIPEPDPWFQLVRRVTISDAGRVESRRFDTHPILQVGLRFGPDTGQNWTAIRAWLNYALSGVPFTLFRNTSDTAAYNLVDAVPNPDGTSFCVLTSDGQEAAKEYLAEPATTHGIVTLEARIVTGY